MKIRVRRSVKSVAYFNASSGSIFAALRAGTRHATSTTAANTIATAMNVTVSIGFTPNSSGRHITRHRERTATPIPIPSTASNIARCTRV